MKLYHELNTKYQHQPEVFWETWWTVLEEYVPPVDWARDARHIQLHTDDLPIQRNEDKERDELNLRLNKIRDQITASMAGLSEIGEGVE